MLPTRRPRAVSTAGDASQALPPAPSSPPAPGKPHAELVRLFVRENLNQDSANFAYEPDAPEVADLRARQAAGEIAEELDPAFVLIALQAIVVSGVVQPGDVKRFLGLDASSQAYLDFMTTQLRRLVRRLREPNDETRAATSSASSHP
jgi:hypothetical protein